ncbi:MAG: molybdopterin-dependent oxidoreductase [Chloroflexi bacterium]|nr:molybdopterin-dependent oxidoreductase [Chloroflexota bacterium]
MKLTRRNFLAWAGLSAVGAVACDVIQDEELSLQSPASLPEDLVKGRDNWYATLGGQATDGEGVIVRVMEGRAKKIQGNPKYPVNQGKQSVRSESGLQALYHPDRISGPLLRTGPRGSGQYRAIQWEPDALDIFRRELRARSQGMVLITEPLRGTLGMIAERFATSVGGSHLGFEALDDTTYRAAVKGVFDQDRLPDFDIGNANYVISFGADFLSTWKGSTRLSTAYGDFRQGSKRQTQGSRGYLVHVDPRFSLTAANADEWLPIRPGMEGYLALSLAYVIISEGMQAEGVDVDALTNGQGAAALAAFAPEQIAGQLGIPEQLHEGKSGAEKIRDLASNFAHHGPSIALGGDNAGAHTNGQFNLMAIYVLNYLTGSVGSNGGMRFSPGSPLGNLADAAKIGSAQDWAGVAGDIRSGRTRLVLVHDANPVHGLPASMAFESALNRDDVFIVSFSSFMDETTALADLILPDRVFLEGWGDDVPEPGPGYEVIGMQQPVVNPLSDLDPRSFGDILLSMAQEMGQEGALPWTSVEEAMKSGVEALYNTGRGTSSHAASADDLWNLMLRQGGWWDEDATGPAPTAPSGILNTIAAQGREPGYAGSGDFYLLPFAHNTLLDGRLAHIPWMQGVPDPVTTVTWQTWVELNSSTASQMGLREGDIVSVSTDAGSISGVLYPNPALPPNVVAVPLGQGRKVGSDYATSGDARESSNALDLLSASHLTESGALAWAGHRASVSGTGESMKIAKFEGIFPARQIGHTAGEAVIIVTNH